LPRLTALHWKQVVSVFKAAGWQYERTKGSHMVYSKEGTYRPLIIPKYNEICVDIIKDLMKTACMSREEFFRLLG